MLYIICKLIRLQFPLPLQQEFGVYSFMRTKIHILKRNQGVLNCKINHRRSSSFSSKGASDVCCVLGWSMGIFKSFAHRRYLKDKFLEYYNTLITSSPKLRQIPSRKHFCSNSLSESSYALIRYLAAAISCRSEEAHDLKMLFYIQI